MAISVGGTSNKRPRDLSPRFYEAICAEVAELDASDQGSLALAFTTGQPWRELPDGVKALVTNLLDWVRENAR